MIKSNQIKSRISSLLEQTDFKGSLLASNSEGILFCNSFGLANAELNVQNTIETKFRIGSLTKQFTALAILQLIQQGQISLESTLNQFIADYPSGTNITIHHLLSHSSGIYNFSNRSDIMEWYKGSSTVIETIHSFRSMPPVFIPGEEFEYSNSNYILLTYIIEQVSGHSYEEYLKKYIFTIIDMSKTGYDYESEIIADRASGYYYDEGLLKNAPYINIAFLKAREGFILLLKIYISGIEDYMEPSY